MKGLITICARGGSKGVPGKNIKEIRGKPLISYSLEVALELSQKYDLDVFLSTDSAQIKNVVAALAIQNVDLSYTRPEFLASDTAGKLDAIEDVYRFAEAKNNVTYDFVIDLDVTSPLRTAQDLGNSINILFGNSAALNLFSVSPANRNPYFNMVEETPDGFVALCKKGEFLTRQSAPRVYDMNASFYIFKKQFFEQKYKTVITDKSIVYEVPHLCFDLDHQIDFELMSYLIENKKLDFDFKY